MEQRPVSVSRQELNDMRKEYRDLSHKSLDTCFGYLNFYVTLLVAILAATLTGLLRVRPGDPRAFLLLTGPVAMVVLVRLCYQTIVVFYRRFIEAWVTEINVEAILATDQLFNLDGFGEPLIRSRSGGWIAKFERPEVEAEVRSAADAESLVMAVTRRGDTLQYAKWTLLLFVAFAAVLSAICIVIAIQLDSALAVRKHSVHRNRSGRLQVPFGTAGPHASDPRPVVR
jgi:hypothetical protein